MNDHYPDLPPARIRRPGRLILLVVVLAVLMAVSACSSKPPVRVPVEVRIPVPVDCAAKMPPELIYPTEGLNSSSSDADIVEAMFREIEKRGAVEDELRALLRGCVGG